jgi:hypothetical protein
MLPNLWRRKQCKGQRAHRPSGLSLEALESRWLLSRGLAWSDFAHDAQHSGLAAVPSQSLDTIAWQTPVDQRGYRDIHEGSPVVTKANTVIVPVRSNRRNPTFHLEGFHGADGTLLWSQPSDYNDLKLQGTAIFAPVLTRKDRVYFPGAGGTVYYIANPDDPGATITGQLAFYGIANHDPSLDTRVFINTPLTADRDGTIYFGFVAMQPNALNLTSGIARMDVHGHGTWVAASTAAGDMMITQVATNCAPALSHDEHTLYVAVDGSRGHSYLVALDSATLQPLAHVALMDPKSGGPAYLYDGNSATPMVGPDGDVYYGVLDASTNGQRGWMLHFSGDLAQTKLPGSFGWDTTASVVPSSLVPSYTGKSSYLIATKYNRYNMGVYQIGILDPNGPMMDPFTDVTVMQEVLTVDGPTPGKEWCINDAAVDPYTDSILANSEDGNLYRWDLASNTLVQSIALNWGTSEAYTPTLIGVDGTVYSVNGGQLFAIQAVNGTGRPSSLGRDENRLREALVGLLGPGGPLAQARDSLAPTRLVEVAPPTDGHWEPESAETAGSAAAAEIVILVDDAAAGPTDQARHGDAGFRVIHGLLASDDDVVSSPWAVFEKTAVGR